MDKLTKEQRSKNMKAVKNKNSKIELLLRKALRQRGFGYRKNYRALEGTPDIVLTKYKIAIFCDSEFWHGFDWEHKKLEIKSNREFWYKKIEGNIARDKFVTETLSKQGWTVVRFWGGEILKNPDLCAEKIRNLCTR